MPSWPLLLYSYNLLHMCYMGVCMCVTSRRASLCTHVYVLDCSGVLDDNKYTWDITQTILGTLNTEPLHMSRHKSSLK